MDQIQFDYIDQQRNQQKRDYISLKDNDDIEIQYKFSLSEEGPLKIFIDEEFIQKLKKNIEKEQKDNDLLNCILKTLQKDVNDNEIKNLAEIDNIISSAIEYLQKEKVNLQNENFDYKYFDLEKLVDELEKKAVGCISLCDFCKRKCELSKHSEETDHSCNIVGHQQRVFFSGGYFQNQDGIPFPLLDTCDQIDQNKYIKFNGHELSWNQIVQNYAKGWKIEYNSDKKQEVFNNLWQKVGKKYCEVNDLEFIEDQYQYLDIYNGKHYQSSIEVIILDESWSMEYSGKFPLLYDTRWQNAVKGAKEYIDYLQNNHINKEKVQLIIIFFTDEPRVIHNGNLNDDLKNIQWDRKGWATELGKPLQKAIELINLEIRDKQRARIYFFTDDTNDAEYPLQNIENIKQLIQQNKSIYLYRDQLNLKIALMCENENNPTLKQINDNINEFSQKEFNNVQMCQLLTKIKTEELGNKMIEVFNQTKKQI